MSDINPKHIAKAKKAVQASFPEMVDADQTVAHKGHAKGLVDGGGYHVVTFQKHIPLPDGNSLSRAVRVTMDAAGQIVKMTSSK